MEKIVSNENRENSEKVRPYENLSDEEFYDLCRKKYEKEDVFLKYKTITFKKNDKGFFSNDLKKIVLIDNHEVSDQIVEGQPYIVEVIRDTNESEARKGAILVKIIKPAEFKDIVLNQETKDDLVQIQFFKSKKDPNQVVSRDLSKPTLIDRNYSELVHPSDEVVGRVEDKGSIFTFKPIKKAEKWIKFSIGLSYSDKKPIVYKKIFDGIKKIKEESIYPYIKGDNDYLGFLNEADRLIIEEELCRQKIEADKKQKVYEQFERAQKQSASQAWAEYFNEKVLVEEIDKSKESYKVKIDDNWHDVNNNTIVYRDQWREDDDWRRLIPGSALKLINNDKYFFEQLNENENINITEADLNECVPKREFLGSSINKGQEVSHIKHFRKMERVKVPVNLPYISGNLVFEPVLLRRDDVWDSDWGLHKDDSTGASSFTVIYKLQSEEISFNQRINDLPNHISQRIKNFVNDCINSFKDPDYHITSYEMASWQADYSKKIDLFDSMSLSERLEAKLKLSKDELEIFNEKMLFTDAEFIDLQSRLPVEKYAKPDGQGGVNYFGLPFKVEQKFEDKYYPRSGMSTKIPAVGQYDYVFDKYGPEQLSYWLDSHQEYFKRLESEWEGKYRDSQLPKLDRSINDEIERRCKEKNISFSGYNGHEYYYYQESDKLNLMVNLSANFSRLNVVVNNINNGFSVPVNNPQAIYKIIKDNGWRISLSVKNILLKQGVDERLLNDLLINHKNPIKSDQELPFYPL